MTDRADAALEAMSDAVLAIAAERSVERVLQRIVHAARELAGARYAALGIPDGQGAFASFITSGMGDELIAEMGPLPRTHGMLGALLVGEVDRADHTAALDDRHAEERAHVGVALRPPPAKARMTVDVGGPERLAFLEHRSEHAVLPRQRTERGDHRLTHPGGQELAEAALPVRDAQRGVPCIGELACTLDEPLEHLLDRELGRDGENGVADRLQRRVDPTLAHDLSVGLRQPAPRGASRPPART